MLERPIDAICFFHALPQVAKVVNAGTIGKPAGIFAGGVLHVVDPRWMAVQAPVSQRKTMLTLGGEFDCYSEGQVSERRKLSQKRGNSGDFEG